ncbi:MAG: hypothetical protein K2N87_13290 [Eubacterium sp.]|nr:hypothetical protein [Eubacterium sp.]
MKLWKWFIKCPMLFLLLIGWVGLTAFTWSEGRMPEKLDQSLIENPAFTALLEPEVPEISDDLDDLEDLEDLDDLDTQEETPDEETVMAALSGNQNTAKDTEGTKDMKNAESGTHAQDGSDGEKDAAGASADENAGTDDKTGIGTGQDKSTQDGSTQDDGQEVGVTRFREYKKKKTDSRYYSDPGKKALTTEFSYQKVDKSYFDDAVFIGDSRTVGMQDYSGLDNAQFFAKTGMNVYDVLEDNFITDPETGDEVSVAHMLKTYDYGKIYFMVGINELGTGNTGTFQQAYERVLKKFRKWQPNAVIYIQGIIPVSKAKASGDEIFNNININDKNVAIAQLADGKDIFYLDVSKSLTDKSGYLKADYTFDDVHMYAQYYELWTDFLMKHAVVR